MSEECLPWDVKTLKLSLGGESDEYGFITFEVFDDNKFSIREGDGDPNSEWFYEEINIEAARRLRDFLNYAVPK
jgi:hypothetical protein